MKAKSWGHPSPLPKTWEIQQVHTVPGLGSHGPSLALLCMVSMAWWLMITAGSCHVVTSPSVIL